MKLKLQYFGHLVRRADSFEKTLMLGKIEYIEKKEHLQRTSNSSASLEHRVKAGKHEWFVECFEYCVGVIFCNGTAIKTPSWITDLLWLFGIGAQRAKVLATKLSCRDTGVLLKEPYAQAVHTFSSKNLEGCF